VWRVWISPAVQSDIAAAGLGRAALGEVLFDLNNHLPTAAAHYQGNRLPRNPRCFFYPRIYTDGLRLHRFEFVVRDATPGLLEVIWVTHTA
jgi:hypothetical protein